MSLKEELLQDMKAAMKAKEAGKDYFVMSYHINTTSYEIKN